MTTAKVVETSVTVNNSPIQVYGRPDDHNQTTDEMTPGFKPFTVLTTFLAQEIPEVPLISLLSSRPLHTQTHTWAVSVSFLPQKR